MKLFLKTGTFKLPMHSLQGERPSLWGHVSSDFIVNREDIDESISKAVVPVAVTSTKDGIETLSVEEVEIQKVGEAYDREARRMVEFREIKGFSYEIKVWSKVEEALDMIGPGS